MWPKDFRFFKEFLDDLRIIFIFNTIKSYPDGLTYYDLQQYGEIPHSKIYRIMKKLENSGDLIRKNDISNETGRPKHLYFLSKKGEIHLRELKQDIGKIFEFIKLRFPNKSPEFDHVKFLDEATFQVWSSPVEYVMRKKIPITEKVEILTAMESDVKNILKKIEIAKNKLQNVMEE